MVMVNIINIKDSAKNALDILLTEAEACNYEPPVNTEVVAELEYIINACDMLIVNNKPVIIA